MQISDTRRRQRRIPVMLWGRSERASEGPLSVCIARFLRELSHTLSQSVSLLRSLFGICVNHAGKKMEHKGRGRKPLEQWRTAAHAKQKHIDQLRRGALCYAMQNRELESLAKPTPLTFSRVHCSASPASKISPNLHISRRRLLIITRL